jgi:hypothetical protein
LNHRISSDFLLVSKFAFIFNVYRYSAASRSAATSTIHATARAASPRKRATARSWSA